MAGCCSIRALWILNSHGTVVFSRRFSVVERRWRMACEKENSVSSGVGALGCSVQPLLPSDGELVSAIADKKARDGSLQGLGVHVPRSRQGSDSCVDDPITRHIISVCINNGETENFTLWPLVLHERSSYVVLVLPLVEPRHLKLYEKMCRRSDCSNAIDEGKSLSVLMIDLPCITGAFMVAHALGDIVTGNQNEPEVFFNQTSSVGGLLDSLTGSIGISSISARTKPAVAPIPASIISGASVSGSSISDVPKNFSRPIDKDALHTFMSSTMPFGTPLDLNYSNILEIKMNGFSLAELPPADLRQPAWKPYLHKGKQRLLFTIHETVSAAMYDREEIPDVIAMSGQVNCRAEIEGLPDVSLPLTGLNSANVKVLSFHPSAQVPDQGIDKQALMFSPPLGNFVLMQYQAFCNLGPPIKGFYQLSMVSEDEGAFLFKLCLMEGYKAPLNMEFCTVVMPFPRRRIVLFDGIPSVGTISMTDYSVEWKIIPSGRSVTGKSIEATFPGTIRFAPMSSSRFAYAGSAIHRSSFDADSDLRLESFDDVEEFLSQKMYKDLISADLEEPFCWKAYNYAKVSFRILGGTLSGLFIDPKSVSIYPSIKGPIECSMQVTSGDYILWNTLGKCPHVDIKEN